MELLSKTNPVYRYKSGSERLSDCSENKPPDLSLIMNYQEADARRQQHQSLIGRTYFDPVMKQSDLITDIVVTPQDHPFYPQFLEFYKQTGSYHKASLRSYQLHGNDILYAVKCILDEPLDYFGDLKIHVIMDLGYVLQYLPPSPFPNEPGSVQNTIF